MEKDLLKVFFWPKDLAPAGRGVDVLEPKGFLAA